MLRCGGRLWSGRDQAYLRLLSCEDGADEHTSTAVPPCIREIARGSTLVVGAPVGSVVAAGESKVRNGK